MSVIAAALKHMLAANMPHDAILAAVEDMERGLQTDEQAERRRAAKTGPLERWGYSGPITAELPFDSWLVLRATVLRRDGYVCRYCGAAGQHSTKWTADHVLPLSRGGSNDLSNLVACCVPCNCSKSDRLLSEWSGRS